MENQELTKRSRIKKFSTSRKPRIIIAGRSSSFIGNTISFRASNIQCEYLLSDAGPSADQLENLRSLWYEMFIFNQSDGEKIRQGTNFKLQQYDQYFKNLRFDDNTHFTAYQKLYKLKGESLENRMARIANSKWASFGEFTSFGEMSDGGDSDATDDEYSESLEEIENIGSRGSSAYDTDNMDSTDNFGGDSGQFSMNQNQFFGLSRETSIDPNMFSGIPNSPSTPNLNQSWTEIRPNRLPTTEVIYQIQLHAIWIEEFWNELLEFRALFPTIKDAQLQAIEFGVGQKAYSFRWVYKLIPEYHALIGTCNMVNHQ